MQPLLHNVNNISTHAVINHNLVVFRNGENANQVLPPLVHIIPEARYNLLVYYITNEQVEEACMLIKDFEPSTTPEQMLKAALYAIMSSSNKRNSRE